MDFKGRKVSELRLDDVPIGMDFWQIKDYVIRTGFAREFQTPFRVYTKGILVALRTGYITQDDIEAAIQKFYCEGEYPPDRKCFFWVWELDQLEGDDQIYVHQEDVERLVIYYRFEK